MVRLMQRYPSLGRKGQRGGRTDPEDAAWAGAYAIYCLVDSHAPSKQLFLEAGVEEVLRGILAHEETSGGAKMNARNVLEDQLGLHA